MNRFNLLLSWVVIELENAVRQLAEAALKKTAGGGDTTKAAGQRGHSGTRLGGLRGAG